MKNNLVSAVIIQLIMLSITEKAKTLVDNKQYIFDIFAALEKVFDASDPL